MQPRARAIRPAAWAALLAAFLLACAPKAPPDPGLLGEDFGTGVRLGMTSADAQSAGEKSAEWLMVDVLSHDDYANRSAYAERPQDKDLLLAVFVGTVAPDQPAGVAASGIVDELRCYLAPPGLSRLTLMGKPLAVMKPQDVIELLGKPLTRTDANDGKIHLLYRFSQKERGKPDLSLTVSHEIDGHCFAVLLSQVPELK